MLILGLHDGHNAAAAVMKDGEIIAAANEERFTYRKNDMGFPARALESSLDAAGVSAGDIDLIAFSTQNIPLKYLRIKRESSFGVRDWLDEQEHYWRPLLYENEAREDYWRSLGLQKRFQHEQAYDFQGVPWDLSPQQNADALSRLRREAVSRSLGAADAKVVAFDHHFCHQHYAYFASPFRGQRCLVVSCDGGGDGRNAVASLAEGDRLQELAGNNHTDLARLYRYITLILGMKIGEHEYKVMGLAPYASQYEIRKCDKVFRDLFHVPGFMVEYKRRPPDLFFHFRDELADCRFDGIAGAVQEMVEDVAGQWVGKLLERFDCRRLVISGGLAMNVKMNQALAGLPGLDEFYVPASGGDDSLAIGACYAAQRTVCKGPCQPLRQVCLGPAFSRGGILTAVRGLGGVEISQGVEAEQVAGLLAGGMVVARFQGRMEFGARALGNRSILAHPGMGSNVQKINRQIKFRDFWMPFAPTILDSWAPRYLENPKGLLSDHMTMAFPVTAEGEKALAAALHPADRTVRAHILHRRLNPGYYRLIELFAAKTGIGALLNTSFNLHGYPMVCSPEQACHVFENSGLDAMWLEDVLVTRRLD